ncbi:MAG: PDZ domain-containing protein, partial [Chloroflexi bacterium]|nr:PDZ domain-containing protein [Chloroflexota bacterium]
SWRDERREYAVTLGDESDAPPFRGQGNQGRGNQGNRIQMRGTFNFLGLNAELTDDGLLINELDEDSALAEAGLQVGDLITAINGEPVTGYAPGAMLRLFVPEEELILTVLRDGEELEITVELPDMFQFEMRPGQGPRGPFAPPTQLGISFIPLTPEIAEGEDLDASQGAWVQVVYDDTPAAAAGLEEGDIILSVDDNALNDDVMLPDVLAEYEEGDVVMLTVLRDGEEIELDVELGPRGVAMFMGDEPFLFFGTEDGMYFEMSPFMFEGRRFEGRMFEGQDQIFFHMPPFHFGVEEGDWYFEMPAPEVPEEAESSTTTSGPSA